MDLDGLVTDLDRSVTELDGSVKKLDELVKMVMQILSREVMELAYLTIFNICLTLVFCSSSTLYSSLALLPRRLPSSLPLVALPVATAVSSLANLYTLLYRTIRPLCNLSFLSLHHHHRLHLFLPDKQTLLKLSTEGNVLDERVCIGLWRIVIVRNLPYKDMHKTGKVPKFLSRRLFPSSRYSIWLASKMRLQTDPVLIIEFFLWQTRLEYAISNHYTRHCVWKEMCLKVHLLLGPIHRCQIYFNAFGLMKLTVLHHVIN
ncbi:uncharacterized protein LOC114316314 [Camellia sinensis]|uniref:uncharacterized protein LOC114316314 n=1 Tax=Camellia sinensis TaxID=4442 RepID=UPI001035FAC5|nr:uncharacterized protein LOC114316314 [Camellia sinensis]